MSLLDRLVSGLGTGARSLAGTNELRFTPDDPGVESPARAELMAVLRDTFVRLDYQWTYKDAPQFGTLLVGADEHGSATASWADTFHMSRAIMFLQGRAATIPSTCAPVTLHPRALTGAGAWSSFRRSQPDSA